MNRKLLIVSLIALALLAANRWEQRPLKHPPGILAPQPPVQEDLPESVFRFEDYILTRKARFELTARVLSTERYFLGREADLSPIDLALGWGVMSDQAVLDQLSISQSGRWYFTRYEHPAPLADQQIVRNSSNMHMIPARSGVDRSLKKLRPGELVQLNGFLVNVDHPSGWHWETSLSRDDAGAGACEVFYVESLSLVAAP